MKTTASTPMGKKHVLNNRTSSSYLQECFMYACWSLIRSPIIFEAMTSLALQDATELVAKYVARASSESADRGVCSPCRLARIGFGAAVGHSWTLSPVDCWVRLDIVSLRPSMAQQLQTRRALLELICQLSVTPSCRWEESFESLWWPAVLRPADFKDEKYLETVRDVGAAPKFALFMGKPTLEGVQMFFQFLQMDPQGLLDEEDRQLIERLQVPGSGRRGQRVEICLRLANNIVYNSILRSIVDGMRGLLAMGDTSEEEEEDFHRIEFEVTSLWFGNCRFLSASDALESLAEMVTLPSSTIRNLMLPGVYLNSLRNPAGLQSFQSFSRQVLAPSSPLRSLDLTRVGIDGNCMTALCSALQYSSPLVKLSVGYTTRGAHSNSRLLWAWIFLSVFHVDSGSGLEHVDVSGLQLQAQDVEALVAMLESPHPGRILVLLQDGRLPEGEGCEECELPPERLFVRLLDGSQAWTNPGYSAAWPQLLPGTLQAYDFEYEVMVCLADWLCILIPGFGFGWVVRSAVRYERLKPSNVSRMSGASTRPGLRSLTYRGADEQSNGVLGLLRLLGTSLISLDAPACGLNSQDLGIILHICPNLSSLNLTHNLMTDLSPLLRLYEDSHCQLTRLGILVESNTPTIAAQLQTLLLHSSGKPLERLQLEVIGHETEGDNIELDIWSGLQRALSTNTTLHCLYLSLLSAETHKTATALIKPFHGQVLHYKTPLQLKTSFLSVVEHGNVGSLDHMVLSNIFSIAATSAVCREVHVRR